MPIQISDKLLWGLAITALVTAYYIIPRNLQEIKDAARIPKEEPDQEARKIGKDAENQIATSTLRVLADGHSFGCRNSSIKIVADRIVNGKTRDLLLKDLRSKNYEVRENAINGLWMLIYSPALNDKHLQDFFLDYKTFDSLVTALVNVLPLHQLPSELHKQGRLSTLPDSPIRPYHRPPHEVSLIIILTNLLHYQRHRSPYNNAATLQNLALALQAGLVSKWLTHYPFPCSLRENQHLNFKKSDVVSLFERRSWASDDSLMSDLMSILTHSPFGLKELRAAGLRTSSYTENVDHHDRGPSAWRRRRGGAGGGGSGGAWHDDDDDDDDDDNMEITTTITYNGLPIQPDLEALLRESSPDDEILSRLDIDVHHPPRPRSVERSQEEEMLRRRRREAIVVAETGEPFRRENILQRENSELGIRPYTNGLGTNITAGGGGGGGDNGHDQISDDGSMPGLVSEDGDFPDHAGGPRTLDLPPIEEAHNASHRVGVRSNESEIARLEAIRDVLEAHEDAHGHGEASDRSLRD